MSVLAKQIRSALLAGTVLSAALNGAALAQSGKATGVEQVTKPLPADTLFATDLSADFSADNVVVKDASKDPFFKRAMEVSAHVVTNLQKKVPEFKDFYAVDKTETNALALRVKTSHFVVGSCNSGLRIATSEKKPYLIVPDAWVGQSLGATPEGYLNDHDLPIGASIGMAQAAQVCADAFPDKSVEKSPYASVMSDVGFVFGMAALDGVTGLSNTDERGQTRFFQLGRQLNQMRSDGALSSVQFDSYAEGGMDRYALTTPFLQAGAGKDRIKFIILDRLNVDLPALYKSKPEDPRDHMKVLSWLDDNLNSNSGEDIQLGKALPIFNFIMASRIFYQDVPMKREIWQDGMNGEKGKGCAHVTLSRDTPMQDISFKLEPAASYCVTVSWQGKAQDPELPPQFALLATSAGGKEVLDGLQLAADQRFERKIEGVAKIDKSTVEIPQTLPWHFYRNAILVEEPRTGKAVKNWELAHKEDVASKDGVMTLVFTNLNKEDVTATKAGTFNLTIGDGIHEAKADLDVTTFKKDDYLCETAKKITPPMPKGRMKLVELGRTYMGNDGLGYDKAPSFGGKFVMGMDDPLFCSRVLGAVGLGGLGEDLKVVYGNGGADSQLLPNAPQVVCAKRQAKLQAMMNKAMKGQQVAVPKTFEVNFEVTPRSRLTGPGTYKADFSLMYSQPELEEDGFIEPTYADGEGTVTVLSQTATHMRLKYDVKLDDRGESCDGRLEGRISGEIVTPFALASAQDLISYAAHPRDVLGEKVWSQMSQGMRDQLITDWNGERTSSLRKLEVDDSGSGGNGGGIAQGCVVTKDDIDAIIEAQTKDLTEEQKKSFSELYQLLYEPDYPKEVLCAMKKEYLKP